METETVSSAFAEIRRTMRDEYNEPHDHPWIIGYSGGKDSTLVAHLVFEMLLELAPTDRCREVHVVSNDTLVESPLVMNHIRTSITEISDAAQALNLPVKTAITQPETEHSFWVNLIGRGYPTPNQQFRWCTDRMKIRPTSSYILNRAAETGQAVLLLGVRRSESASRSGIVRRYDTGERLHPHSELRGCMVFRPILELDTDDVWEFLAQHRPPWGGNHDALIQLYRDSAGGECPVVTGKADAPSCGTTSSRFGCWTCTVVTKDRSLEGFIETGYAEFGPLLDFRDWLVSIRNEPGHRQAAARNGALRVSKSGTVLPGPFTIETRQDILDRLLALQDATGMRLIAEEEVDLIRKLWIEDMGRMTAARTPAADRIRVDRRTIEEPT